MSNTLLAIVIVLSLVLFLVRVNKRAQRGTYRKQGDRDSMVALQWLATKASDLLSRAVPSNPFGYVGLGQEPNMALRYTLLTLGTTLVVVLLRRIFFPSYWPTGFWNNILIIVGGVVLSSLVVAGPWKKSWYRLTVIAGLALGIAFVFADSRGYLGARSPQDDKITSTFKQQMEFELQPIEGRIQALASKSEKGELLSEYEQNEILFLRKRSIEVRQKWEGLDPHGRTFLPGLTTGQISGLPKFELPKVSATNPLLTLIFFSLLVWALTTKLGRWLLAAIVVLEVGCILLQFSWFPFIMAQPH